MPCGPLATAGWRRGYAADCKAPLVSRQINRIPENRYQDIPRTGGERDNSLSSPEIDTKENPGALAGATEANFKSWLDCIDLTIQRRSAATALMRAVLDCHPSDRLELLERFHGALRPGFPITPLDSLMDEAAFWADMAGPSERKAYALACYNRLSPTDQARFLAYVQKGAA